jgi:hypothetical protein
MLMNVIGCGSAGTQQEFEPAAALALGADLAAANEIALRHDADELAAGIDHGKTADMALNIRFAASTILVSGATVMTDRVMI